MSRHLALARRLLLCVAFILPGVLQAAPVQRDVFFEGQGNLVYDASTGMGAWQGFLEESAFPVVPTPLSLLSVVSFAVDSTTGLLSGSFEITATNDFTTTLTGLITASLIGTGSNFADGGQLGVDYSILGGTGDFLAASGFGTSLITFTAANGGFNDFIEGGVFSFESTPGQVPEPGVLALMALGLGVLAVRRHKAPVV